MSLKRRILSEPKVIVYTTNCTAPVAKLRVTHKSGTTISIIQNLLQVSYSLVTLKSTTSRLNHGRQIYRDRLAIRVTELPWITYTLETRVLIKHRACVLYFRAFQWGRFLVQRVLQNMECLIVTKLIPNRKKLGCLIRYHLMTYEVTVFMKFGMNNT